MAGLVYFCPSVSVVHLFHLTVDAPADAHSIKALYSGGAERPVTHRPLWILECCSALPLGAFGETIDLATKSRTRSAAGCRHKARSRRHRAMATVLSLRCFCQHFCFITASADYCLYSLPPCDVLTAARLTAVRASGPPGFSGASCSTCTFLRSDVGEGDVSCGCGCGGDTEWKVMSGDRPASGGAGSCRGIYSADDGLQLHELGHQHRAVQSTKAQILTLPVYGEGGSIQNVTGMSGFLC